MTECDSPVDVNIIQFEQNYYQSKKNVIKNIVYEVYNSILKNEGSKNFCNI